MKSTYEARAIKFARLLAMLFAGCVDLSDFEYAVECYNDTHSRKLRTAHGVSRFTVIRSDYVIKFDMKPTGSFSNGRAGNCHSEEAVYARAVADGMEHLLAKTTVMQIKDHTIAIMPKVNGVGDYDRCWWDHCTQEEYRWLEENVNDLHDGNLGYRRGKVCVIDYAWDAEGVETVDESSSDSEESSSCDSYTTDSNGHSEVDWSEAMRRVVESLQRLAKSESESIFSGANW